MSCGGGTFYILGLTILHLYRTTSKYFEVQPFLIQQLPGGTFLCLVIFYFINGDILYDSIFPVMQYCHRLFLSVLWMLQLGFLLP